jgi:L-amino acid N-acyltransferase YncA
MSDSRENSAQGEQQSVVLRAADAADAAALAAIYNLYITDTVVTFEIEPIVEAEMLRRLSSITATMPWLVAEDSSGAILGYAYATREVTVYLKPDCANLGLGTRLYEALIRVLRETPIHVLIAGIAQPNRASVALHEKLGFKKVGEFEEIGFKFGRRINIGYWQLVL